MDRVEVPSYLRGIDIGAPQTAAIGARPAPEDSRLAVHCKLAVYTLRRLGWEIPDDKTMCGSAMILLGALLDALAGCIRTPELKKKWVLHAVDELCNSLTEFATVPRRLIELFTGRLVNMSQYFPELKTPLAIGYALSSCAWKLASGHSARLPSFLRVKRGGRRMHELLALCDVAVEVVTDDVSVVTAPTLMFDSLESPSTLLVVTDASRADVDNGFGGYAFLAASPGTVYLLSQPWPPGVKRALAMGAKKKSERRGPGTDGVLSMPAGEAFAILAITDAVVALSAETELAAVIAVGDCAPAAAALSARFSKSAQIRALLTRCSRVVQRWLGVQVPRDMNFDSDRLSHPSKAAIVATEASAARLDPVWLRPSGDILQLLEAVCHLPLGGEDGDA